MDRTPARSLAGAARRSRRLQGTPAGHTGSATTASGSPYARPTLRHNSSSQTLGALESGSSGPAGSKDVKLDRRKSVAGSDGLFGRVRRGLGWLVGRTSETAPEEEEQADQEAGQNGQREDEESMIIGSTRPRPRATPGNTLRTSSNLSQAPPRSVDKRDFGNTPSVLSVDDFDGDESAKKLRTSHSTLNLPRRASPPKSTRKPHSSAGPMHSRALSPGRPLSPEPQSHLSTQGKASIFPSGPLSKVAQSSRNGFSSASRGSISPGGMSQYAVASQPTSGASSAFGLQSQSPFRIGGHTARSPDLAALNISSGLARSPSLPAERLLNLQRNGTRLYPYQRSPSILSGLARPPTLPASLSVQNTLATGSKRDFGAMSMSPPKASPRAHGFYRPSPSGFRASPTNTDYGSEFSHRSKRARVSVAWHPEKGYISTDADGNPLHDDAPPPSIPKNEAERILERLENIRRPQIDGLRSSSPRRLNVPLPTSTPGKGSIFATQISSSRKELALASYAISPYARRQQAYREERAIRRDVINSRGGLGEHLRVVNTQQQYAPSQPPQDDHSDHLEDPRSDWDDASNIDEQRDDEAPLPKPVKRRTRQRTRELSVMSDSSVQQDEAPASLRRSTRIRNKPANDESETPRRERKSAKSPPPTDSRRSNVSKKNKQAATKDADGSDTEMDADKPSRAASPRRVKSPAKNNGSSARPASPPPSSRAVATIDQVIAAEDDTEVPSTNEILPTPKRNAREQRLSAVQTRKARGFSAKDDIEDEIVTSATAPEQPKLKLPNSVFANRFSFGRSPSSSLLASPATKPVSADVSSNASTTAAATAVPTQSLPKLALPTSASSTASAAPSAPSPAIEATKAAQAGVANDAFTRPAMPSGPTQLVDTTSSSNTNSVSKPLFAFKAPETSLQPVPPAQDSAAKASQKPTFSFGGPASTTTAPSAEKPVAPFSFGQTSSKTQDEKAAPPPTFSFGKPAATAATESIPTIDLTKPSNPFAAFPGASAATPPASNDTSSAPKKPAFSFGTQASTSSPAQGTSSSAAVPGVTATSAPTFKFGGTSSSAPAFGSSQSSEGAGMQSSPPAASTTTEPPATAPFSPVVSASKPPAFSFGGSGGSTNGAAPTASTPSFSFGAQAPTQNETKSRSASPFAIGAPAQPFSFGKKEEAPKPATPTFSFGAPSSTATESDKPASSGGFTFGAASPAASTATTPAFSFGAAKPASTNPFAATAPGMQPSGSAFGSATAQAAPAFGQNTAGGATSTPSFSFGAQPNGNPGTSSASAFSFGASSTPAASTTPSFSFGAGSTSSAQPFAFGGSSTVASPAATNAVPNFNFSAAAAAPGSQVGSPAGTPTGAGPAAGNFFTMGAGDATSPNKARRPVKPLRRPR